MIAVRGRKRPFGIATLLGILAIVSAHPSSAAAASEGPDAAVEGIVNQATWLEERGQLEQAQELLQRAAESSPKNELLVLARAANYLRAENPFWAAKVLGEYLEERPDACAARAMAARVQLSQANLEPAARLLDTNACATADEWRLRYALLRLELAELEGKRQQLRTTLREARGAKRRFEEDDRRLMRLTQRYDPYHQPAFSWQLDIGAGFATKGLGILPLDLPTPSNASSAGLVGTDLSLRWVPFDVGSWRPVAEGELHLVQFPGSSLRALSYRQPIWRLGVELGRGPRRLQLGYAGDFVDLEGGSGFVGDSSAHAQGHRVEMRARLGDDFSAYGALGYRSFWERERTRLELDQGFTKSFELSNELRLSIGGSTRVYSAEGRAYDQFGATAHVALGIALPQGFALRESLALGYDRFPRSEGYFDAESQRGRSDVGLRIGIGLLSPAVAGVRFGLDYGYASRDSAANAYDFVDHRGVLSVSWASNSDRVSVQTIAKSGRVTMPYPDDDPKGQQKRLEVLETIERDDNQRRNTSCMK